MLQGQRISGCGALTRVRGCSCPGLCLVPGHVASSPIFLSQGRNEAAEMVTPGGGGGNSGWATTMHTP